MMITAAEPEDGATLSPKPESYLRLDVDLLCGVFVEPAHVDFTVKVSDVADDGVVLHVLKVAEGNAVNMRPQNSAELGTKTFGRF